MCTCPWYVAEQTTAGRPVDGKPSVVLRGREPPLEEVPPIAARRIVRQVAVASGPEPGSVVVGVFAGVAVVALASVCGSSHRQRILVSPEPP